MDFPRKNRSIVRRIRASAGLAVCLLCLAGCDSANLDNDGASAFMAQMDALPPEEQVPNWENTRILMTRAAPQVGDLAPDFELETRDGDGTIQLSVFGANRPVVLIFGSWT